ncbi:hypothetical protein GE09DRAFT_1052363 [Coniochaeta sp. 2T2.1]|nr:hypothetical protein GE09DRAFT_1052363 [Coniochaeta sp. 2T2.1]
MLFDHILRYLRRGVLPIFFDQARGHDYALYLSLLEEARYFGIFRLEEWLANKRYLNVFEIKRTLEIRGDDLPLKVLEGHDETLTTNVVVKYHSWWGTKKIYVCPRGIPVHRGRPEACGKQCHNTKMETGVLCSRMSPTYVS